MKEYGFKVEREDMKDLNFIALKGKPSES